MYELTLRREKFSVKSGLAVGSGCKASEVLDVKLLLALGLKGAVDF